MADASTKARPFKKVRKLCHQPAVNSISDRHQVLIVGAGPSGLLLAVLLARHGIPVHIVEASHELDQQPRAAHYGPPAIPELARAGVMEELENQGGMRLNSMYWRRFTDHSVIAGFDGGVLKDAGSVETTVTPDIRTACLPMQDLDAFLLEKFLTKHNGTVSWRHRVVDVGQDEGKAWADIEVLTGDFGENATVSHKTRVEADYIVGCDGANSAVRKSLFGNEYPGKTWDAQIIATNVRSPLPNHFRYTIATTNTCRPITTLPGSLASTTPTSSSTRSTFSYVFYRVSVIPTSCG